MTGQHILVVHHDLVRPQGKQLKVCMHVPSSIWYYQCSLQDFWPKEDALEAILINRIITLVVVLVLYNQLVHSNSFVLAIIRNTHRGSSLSFRHTIVNFTFKIPSVCSITSDVCTAGNFPPSVGVAYVCPASFHSWRI